MDRPQGRWMGSCKECVRDVSEVEGCASFNVAGLVL